MLPCIDKDLHCFLRRRSGFRHTYASQAELSRREVCSRGVGAPGETFNLAPNKGTSLRLRGVLHSTAVRHPVSDENCARKRRNSLRGCRPSVHKLVTVMAQETTASCTRNGGEASPLKQLIRRNITYVNAAVKPRRSPGTVAELCAWEETVIRPFDPQSLYRQNLVPDTRGIRTSPTCPMSLLADPRDTRGFDLKRVVNHW